MKFKELKQDWLLVEIEPPLETTKDGRIILTGPQPVRKARVLMAGPGRRYRDRYVPMELKVGDRFPFFKAASETKQGYQLAHLLDEHQALIRESDALFVIEEGDPEVSL